MSGCTLLGETLVPAGGGVPGVMLEVGDGDVRDGFGGVEGGGLIEAVVECVEQAVIEAEAGANRGFAVAEHIPGKADARLGEEVGAIVGERGTADDGVGLQNAVDECVVGGAALRLRSSRWWIRSGSRRGVRGGATA